MKPNRRSSDNPRNKSDDPAQKRSPALTTAKRVMAGAIAALLVLPSLLAAFVPDQTARFEENRNPAAYPERFDETFFTEWEKWYNDRAPFRNTWMNAYTVLNEWVEGAYQAWLKSKSEPVLPEPGTEDSPSTQPDYFEPIRLNSSVMQGRGGWLFYTADNNLDWYQGKNVMTEAEMTRYGETLRTLSELCTKKGKRLAVLICPSKPMVYSEFMPTLEIENETRREQRLYSFLRENYSDVNFLYPLEELTAAKSALRSENPSATLYYANDTHYNHLGGYVCAAELMKSLGVSMPALAELPITDEGEHAGDLAKLVQSNNFKAREYDNHYDDSLGTLERGEGSIADYPFDRDYRGDDRYYRLGFGESYGMKKGTTLEVWINAIDYDESKDGNESFFLIGDSYRGALRDVVSKHFFASYFVHRQNLDVPIVQDFLLKKSEVICLEAVERYDAELLRDAEKLIELLRTEP